MTDSADLIAEAERLGDQVSGHPENVPAVLPQLVQMLQTAEPTVLAAVVRALGSAWDEQACLAVLPFATHPDRDVRLEVARAAPGGLESDEAQQTVASVLIALSQDASDEIRDWATFGLGSLIHTDSPQIRDALAARLVDSHFDTRCEAVVGLAERKDARAFDPIRELLGSDSVPRLAVDAARALGDPRLLAPLRELQSWWDVDSSLLAEALAACETS